MSKRILLKEDERGKGSYAETFRRNINALGKATVEIDNLPAGLPKVHEWRMLYTDVQLVLEKQFKKEYSLVGTKQKAGEVIDKVGDVKHVRISTFFPSYRILRKGVMESKFKNEYEALPKVLEYDNKFVAWDRPDFHLLGMQMFCDRSLLGPCRVIDLSGITRKQFGNVLGKKNDARLRAVFDFLGVPEEAEDEKTPDVDASGNKLTQHQKDLFDTGSDEETITLRLAKPEEADITLKQLDRLENKAHKIRAVLLGIQRIKAALGNAQDRTKKSNLKKSLRKFLNYKKKYIDKK